MPPSETALYDPEWPKAVEYEQALFGAVFTDPQAFDTLRESISPQDFWRVEHADLLASMCVLSDRGIPISLRTVLDELRRTDRIEQFGGPQYIAQLSDMPVPLVAVKPYAGVVRDAAQKRRLVEVGKQIEVLGFAEDVEAPDAVARATALLEECGKPRQDELRPAMPEVLKRVAERLEWAIEHPGTLSGIPTGLADLDRMISGLSRKQLVTIGARTSQGKSALAGCIAWNVARSEGPTLFLSLEMGEEEIVTRLVSAHSNVLMSAIKGGRMSPDMQVKVWDALAAIQETPLTVESRSGMTISAVRARVRERARLGLKLLVVDYLQLLRTERRAESRAQEVGELSAGLKGIAVEFDIPVIAVAQLSRETDKRAGNRPDLSDLRESGSIENDSDVVLMIYRPEFYEAKRKGTAPPECEKAEILVMKQRNGPVGPVPVTFLGKFCQFSTYVEERI